MKDRDGAVSKCEACKITVMRSRGKLLFLMRREVDGVVVRKKEGELSVGEGRRNSRAFECRQSFRFWNHNNQLPPNVLPSHLVLCRVLRDQDLVVGIS